MTFGADEPGQILSQDARGRVLVSRERRQALLEECDRSGMSAVKFAQYIGILCRVPNLDVCWISEPRLIVCEHLGRVIHSAGEHGSINRLLRARVRATAGRNKQCNQRCHKHGSASNMTHAFAMCSAPNRVLRDARGCPMY